MNVISYFCWLVFELSLVEEADDVRENFTCKLGLSRIDPLVSLI